MKRTAILGIGSPFGDDRAGWLVIETLEAAVDPRMLTEAGITIAALDRPGAALLEHMRGFDRAVLIDAVRGDASPGTVLTLDAGTLGPGARLSSHGVGVAEALALGAELGMLPAELSLFGIAVNEQDRALDEDLDGPVSESVRKGVLRVATEIAIALGLPAAASNRVRAPRSAQSVSRAG